MNEDMNQENEVMNEEVVHEKGIKVIDMTKKVQTAFL